MEILVLNGPNLDLLGVREPDTYGRTTLAEVTARLDALAGELGVSLRHAQHNGEGALLTEIRDAWRAGVSGAVINAGGLTHTSVVLRDTLLGTGLPFVEVHVTNVYAREAFRHRSLLADVALGVVVGLGAVGYELALRGLVHRLREGG